MQIHELNDYNGNIPAGYLAIDDGADTGKISTDGLLLNVNEKIDQASNDLNARIDNIIAGGDAPSEAEIIDARLSSSALGDQNVYPSLGDAIRGQVAFTYGHIQNNKYFADSLYKKFLPMEKAVYKTWLDILPMFRYAYFEGSGYVDYPANTYISTQVFEPGKYNIVAPAGYQYEIYYYNSDSSGTLYFSWRTSLTNQEITKPFVITFRHTPDPTTTEFTGADIMNLRSGLTLQFDNTVGGTTRIYGVSSEVIAEFYLLDDTYTPYGCRANSGSYRMKLKTSGGVIRVNGQDANYKNWSDKIQRFVDPGTGEIVAYYILHYTGTDYSIDSNSLVFASYAKTLEHNPRIAEYLSRDENLVLIGDSIFGYFNLNVLEAVLSTISDKKVYNCGFGGCRMSWRTADGSDQYDPYSFVSVADAIDAGDYSSQIAHEGLNQGYIYAIANLKNIDWSKPTTVFVNYVNNDITGNVPIGDLWEYTDAITDFNKQSVIGAFNYGLYKLLTKYPHVRVVEFTTAYRKLGLSAQPPYVYQNSLGLKCSDYDDAIKENAERLGVSVYECGKYEGRNWLNISYYQQDDSHYNDYGYALFAKVLNALDHSFID